MRFLNGASQIPPVPPPPTPSLIKNERSLKDLRSLISGFGFTTVMFSGVSRDVTGHVII